MYSLHMLLQRMKQPPMYTSFIRTPQWLYTHLPDVEPILSLVVQVDAVDPVATDPTVLDSFDFTLQYAPPVIGCLERPVLWTRVPFEPYQNRAVLIARCTPDGSKALDVSFVGNSDIFIEPSGLYCDIGNVNEEPDCSPHVIEYVWDAMTE